MTEEGRGVVERNPDAARSPALVHGGRQELRPPDAFIGRDAERRDLREFVLDADAPLSARIIEGPPGAGKTALFTHAIDQAHAHGIPVLAAAPAAAESALSYAALGDLLEAVPADVLDGLASATRRALDAALTGTSGNEPAEDQHGIARAFLEVLRAQTTPGPIVLAVDDVHWIDGPTERALMFALRRLKHARVRLLATRRVGEADQWREALEREVAEERRVRHRLGPLTVDEIALLLRSRIGLRLPRPDLVRLHRRTHGNPLHALELGRALHVGSDGRDARGALDDLSSLLEVRLASLSGRARRTVVAAAAAAHPTVTLLESVTDAPAVQEAVDAGILLRDGTRIRFVHPLYGSVAHALAGADELRIVHRMLAELVDDEEEAALHRARATIDPSEELAVAIEQAAMRAARRGAPEIAAELAENAVRLTPPASDGPRRRRAYLAAEQLLAAGDPRRARHMLEDLRDELPVGRERATVLWRLADTVGDDLDLSTRLSEQALTEAGSDAELQANIHLSVALFTWLSGDLARSAAHVRAAAELAEKAGNERLLAISIGELMHAEAVLGKVTDPVLVERALEIEAGLDDFPHAACPSFQLAVVCSYTDRPDEARPLLAAELKRIEAGGDEGARVGVLFRMSELELRAGNWSRAMRLALEADSLAAQAGIEQEQCVTQTAVAAVSAHLGRRDEAQALGRAALATAVANGDRMSQLRARGVMGFMALSAGDVQNADIWLAPALADMEAMEIGELSIYGVVQNQLDALIWLDRLDEALHVVELCELKAGPQRRAWHLAVAERGRALIAAASGEEGEALRHADAALDEHAGLPQPFELARTFLAKGTIERRFRRRAAARVTLTKALELFDALGAALWAEKAATEISRIGGRTASRNALTETELRVAQLVADGLSNGEVAARMFVTVRTIEAHLSRIYAKLGVRSRVDLARWIGDQQTN